MLHRAKHRDGGAGLISPDNQPDAVREHDVRCVDGVRRNLKLLSAVPAQSGSCTGLVGAEVTCFPPPKPLPATACPEGTGFSTALIVPTLSRYCLATRLTSARVTFRIASKSSSGVLRPSAARAVDQRFARPGIELRWNSA